MAENASTGRVLPSTSKNKMCRFHPGCRHGVICRFLHIDGEDKDEGLCSDIDEKISEIYGNTHCLGYINHSSRGCASICPTLVVHETGDGDSDELVISNKD